jgi:hypothetical protein
MKILPDEKQLYALYMHINKEFFNCTLPDAIIEWDHFTFKPGQLLSISRSDGTKEFKILLSWRYHLLYDTEVIITLKHEMLHILYPDHDEDFRKEAIRIGTYLFAKPFNIPRGRYRYLCNQCNQEFFYDSFNILLSCPYCLALNGDNSLLSFVGLRKWNCKSSEQIFFITTEK